MNIDTLFNILNEKSIQYKLSLEAIKQNKIAIIKEKNYNKLLQQSKALILDTGEKTQTKIKNYIEETVTLALQSVFGEQYTFSIEFDYEKRDQFEVNFFILKKISPEVTLKLEPRKNQCAGGHKDVCSFALRLVCLTLEQPEVIYILILDEPFKNISAKFLPAVGQMVVDISQLLNLQIIMVTHINSFIESANNVIHI